MDGIINLDKPAGMSSAVAVALVRRLAGGRIRAGHAGTLDPFATGVLLVLLGRATRLAERLMDQPKTYEAVVKLGATTPTLDPTSAELPVAAAAVCDRAQVEEVVARFIGEIRQVPPQYSALKVSGRPAYELARRGRYIELPARTVRVYAIRVTDYQWPLLSLTVESGRGFYVRALARDIGEALGCGGYLLRLRRTRVGRFDAAAAATVDVLRLRGVAPYLLAPAM